MQIGLLPSIFFFVRLPFVTLAMGTMMKSIILSLLCSTVYLSAEPLLEDFVDGVGESSVVAALEEESGIVFEEKKKEAFAVEQMKEPGVILDLNTAISPSPLQDGSQFSIILPVESSITPIAIDLEEKKNVALNTSKSVDILEKKETKKAYINLREVFEGAPLIYTVLIAMSILAFALWGYQWVSTGKKKMMMTGFAESLENLMKMGRSSEVFTLCKEEESLLSALILASMGARNEGREAMMKRMDMEGKRITGHLWHKLSILNDIALIAPMIGLLGTVVGMFYAFYDVNRSLESMYTIFDGLGVSVGTTVAGLIVAIVALILHSTLKYRLMHTLSLVEAKAERIVFHTQELS